MFLRTKNALDASGKASRLSGSDAACRGGVTSLVTAELENWSAVADHDTMLRAVIATAINGHADVLPTTHTERRGGNLKDMRDVGARFGFHTQRPGPPGEEVKIMSNAKIQLRLPKDLKDAAMRQAEMSGISLNLFVATAIAARVGATAEAARYFSARGSRTTPARAKALLMRLGTANQLGDEDRLDVPDEVE